MEERGRLQRLLDRIATFIGHCVTSCSAAWLVPWIVPPTMIEKRRSVSIVELPRGALARKA
jgi:hypothetical protein